MKTIVGRKQHVAFDLPHFPDGLTRLIDLIELAGLVGLFGLFGMFGQGTTTAQVIIDQLGYRPEDRKIAFAARGSGKFEIRDASTNAAVFSGTIKTIGRTDENTGDLTFAIDFSPLKTPGSYRVWIPGTETASPPFRIDPSAFNEAAAASLQSFYYQRCGAEVNNGSVWRHPACHTGEAGFFDNTGSAPGPAKDVRGGWHDAGDYNKFVPSTAVSAAFLLTLADQCGGNFCRLSFSASGPESGNVTPDILDEVRWGLEWLLKMQRDDGAVYHKVSIKAWTGEHLPERESDPQYIFGISSASTADFAAVAALGARVIQKWEPKFARELLKHSLDAWKFLELHPDIVPPGGFRNPPGVEGGEYEDANDLDERLWAAVELYRLTGNEAFQNFFLKNYKRRGGYANAVSWQEVQNLAYSSYLQIRGLPVNQRARLELLSALRSYADELVQRIGKNGYHYVLRYDEFYWGSNSIALGHAFALIQAYRVTQKAEYIEAALDQLHYMLGRNPFQISFVTGVGAKSVMRPYHQFSMMLKAEKPVPGLMVGGANKASKLQGKILSDFPGRCYEDNEKNYFVNEVAINYTAPFAFVAGYFSSFADARRDTLTTSRNQ